MVALEDLQQVNVVGNSKSLFDKNYGDEIDKHPTIRFNYIDKLHPCQGSRWDFVASCQYKLINNYGVKPPFHTLILTRWAKTIKQRHSIITKAKMHDWPEEFRIKMINEVKRPSTGFMILYYMEYLGIRCNIFGFDWKNTPSFYQDQKKEIETNSPHDFQNEKRICLDLINKNGWTLYK